MNNAFLSRTSETGFALIVALILLVAVTVIGLVTIRTTLIEQKAASASQDRALSFQAAEAALRTAETLVETNKPTPSYTDADNTCPSSAINNCTNGICPPPDKDCPARWLSSTNFTQWRDASSFGIAGTPQYFIEYLGGNFSCNDGGSTDPMNCKRYRITARSNPGTGRATVILQSVYATD